MDKLPFLLSELRRLKFSGKDDVEIIEAVLNREVQNILSSRDAKKAERRAHYQKHRDYYSKYYQEHKKILIDNAMKKYYNNKHLKFEV